MKAYKPLASALLVCLLGAPLAAQAEDGDWKRGRLYYRSVCTDCHKAETGKTISPAEMTKAEWKAYLDADKHAKSGKANAKVSYYVGGEYRNSIKATNRVAAKFSDVPDAELLNDIRAFVVYGAKDSDQPSRCQ